MLKSNQPLAKLKHPGKLILAAIALMANNVMADLKFYTTGLGNRNQTNIDGIDRISLMGGAPVFIKTTGGLDMDAQKNTISLECKNIPQASFVVPPVSSDDAFSSDTAAGKLAWTIPAAADIFSNANKQYTYFDFNNLPGGLPGAYKHPNGGVDFLTFDVNVSNADFSIGCSAADYTKCRFQYNQQWTPEIYDTVPNQVVAGQAINFYINPMNSWSSKVPGDWEPFYQIKIGDTHTDWEGLIDQSTRPSYYAVSAIATRVGDNRPTKSAEPDINYSLVGRSFIRETARHCNFKGDDCWKVRVHPRIDSISAASGYLSGGQALEIKGFGLSGKDISVKVDGVGCLVNPALSSDTSIICETGAKSTPSKVNVPQPGNYGATRRFINPIDPVERVDWLQINNPTVNQRVFTSLATTWEVERKIWDERSVHDFSGWFYAPETGQYKFYLSADDQIRLYIDLDHPYDPNTPYTYTLVSTSNTNLNQKANSNYYNNWRQYEKPPAPSDDPMGKYQSDWLNMEGGKYYKFDFQMEEWQGEYWAIGSVEFTKPGFVANNHPKASKAIQSLRIEPDNDQPEYWTITCDNVPNTNTDKFVLSLQSPNTSTVFNSAQISCRTGAYDVYAAIQSFFQECKTAWGICGGISTYRTMYLSTGAETTSSYQATKYVYTIYNRKRRVGPSFINFKVTPVGTITAQITVTPPYANNELGKLSSPPISGEYKISCPDPVDPNVVWRTRAITWDQGSNNYVQSFIDEDIPFLRGRVKLHYWNDGTLANNFKFSYRENGISIYLTFDGLHADPPLCSIESNVANPITFGSNTFNLNSEFVRHYGTGLMFEPVGLEFLYTNALKPQVMVKIDGLEGLCTNVNCDYAYEIPAAAVSAQSYDPASQVLSITGISLPTSVISISFGGATCSNSPAPTLTATLIECTLSSKPNAGNYNVEIKVEQGLVPPQEGLLPISIPLVVNSVSPTSVNPLGGALITITGEGFPVLKELVSVTFSDGTRCVVQASSWSTVTCRVAGFSNNDGLARTVTLEVSRAENINGVLTLTPLVSNSSLSIQPIQNLPRIVSIDKTDVSPILKQNIVFTLDAAYTDTLLVSDLKVQVRQASTNYSRDLYVMSVDDTSSPKTFTVKFNGAPVGLYTFYVYANSASQYGQLDTSAISIRTSSSITNVSPLTGSVLGGTVLTIDGTNFSSTIIDQAVKVGNHFCEILTASPTQLTCRIVPTGLGTGQTSSNNEVIVILAAASEATCVGNCMFTFAAPSATINSVTPAFNPATNNIELTVDGLGFSAQTPSDISLKIDGKAQLLKSVDSNTSMVFTVVDINQEATTSLTLLFADGYPAGQAALTPITFTPSFAYVYPNTDGSLGGTLITVRAPGVGIKTATVNLFNVTQNKNICAEAKVTQYGSFTCLTVTDLVINTTDTLQLLVGTVKYNCANTDPNLCKYSQQLANSPAITSVSLSGNTITFNGNLFPSTTDYIANASYQSMKVEFTTWLTNQASATFPLGIPASATAIKPKLFFIRKSDGVVFYAKNSSSVANPLGITAADSPLSSYVSFAGGRQYQITKANLYATLLEPNNRLEFCGNVCTPIADQSNLNTLTCTIPPLATTYSQQNYKIGNSGVLTGTWTANSATQLPNIYDGIYSTEYSIGGTCWIQLTFPDQQHGYLESAKILINGLATNKSPFVGNSVLQGFDGVSYVDIWRLDGTIGEGWNTKTWADGSQPAYRGYKWSSAVGGGCRFGEVVFTGAVVKQDTSASTLCAPKVVVGTTSTDLTNVEYSFLTTAYVDSITPRYGKVSGNELITITGGNFVPDKTTVTIDKVPCVIQSMSSTQIQCLTGKRIGDEPNPSFVIFVEDRGLAANKGNTFTYVQYWSEPSTWGNDAPPQYLEAVYIPPGRTLLVDVDSVPELSFVLIEGSLIFAPHPTNPNHQRTFDAGYIFVSGGYLEVGTEEYPYTSKLTITMHGDVKSPALPTYGNKNIAVRHGTLSMVGKPRQVVWTLLDQTVLPSATQITLLPQTLTFDWAVGEEIVIASTSYSKNEAEVRKIVAVGQDSVDPTKPVLTLDKPLVYKHYAATETYGTDTIDMRAEVGLLTRNVKYRGDPETTAQNKYGAHIMLHSHGDESCVGKIMYIELFDVGQAFKLGRYPIHFHMIGKVSKSLVKGNSIHQTYNRAVTVHAVSYFRIIQNVIYNTMGHTIFIEDAIETKNIIDGNLVIKTNRSWSLLNVDQTPASFWITNPDNTIINNRAAGSDRYGFWFDLQDNPTGPSLTRTVCPINMPLGEFRNNVAHSNGRYGLRLFHGHNPRTNPCGALVYDDSNPSAPGFPYPSNPVIPAIYQDYTGWKNVEVGAIAEKTGAVEWRNFKVADNLYSGLEWSMVDSAIKADGFSKIDGALVIGRSQNTEPGLDEASPYGLIGPRTEWFTAQNIKFFKFDFVNGGYALGDCSHCFFAASTDSGARTITVRGLQFDSTVTNRITYQYPYRGIFFDADGSLTGLGAGSWAIANFLHNEQPECQTNLALYGGQICDNTVQVRRVAFFNTVPTSIQGLNIRIAKYDDSVMALKTAAELDAYVKNLNNYSSATMTVKQDPVYSWAIPYVTGHKYRWFFDIGQLDIQNMKIEVSQRWKPTDKYVLLNLPYTDNREDIDIYTTYDFNYASKNTTGLIPSGTLDPATYANWLSGFNYNDNLVKREFNMVITGNAASSKTLQLNGVRCRENLVPWCNPTPAPTSCTGVIKLWSATSTWPSGVLPQAGEDVIIPSGVVIVFDLAESPILNLIKVEGCLEFLSDNSKDQQLHAYQIYVHTGKFNIGSAATPYTRKATITLYGDVLSQTVTMSNASEAGNKLIANNGEIKMYGKSRSRMSRLLAEAQKGDSSVTVQTGLDWVAGDLLGFAPTGLKHLEAESATIQSYNSATGVLVLTAPLQYYHFGRAVSTAANYQGLDMRGEVVLLTRNIVIQGDKTQNDWQGQFVTSDALQFDANGNQLNLQGLTILNNVEFNNMGQYDTTKAALRFDNSQRTGDGVAKSTVTNCVFHHNGGFAISVVQSKNISVQNCDVFTAKQIGVNLDIVTDVHFDSVNVFDVKARNVIESMNFADKECCVAFCTYTEGTKCYTSSFTNSIIGGCTFAGLLGQGYQCTDPVGSSSTTVIKDIVVHSVDGSGASLLVNRAFASQFDCYQFSHIKAYKNRGGGIGAMYQTFEMRASNIVLVDNQLGITLSISGPTDTERVIKFSDSYIYGENNDLSNDCPDPSTGAECYCPTKYGFMNFYGCVGEKDAHITSISKRPVYNTKTDAIWQGKVEMNNVNFLNFKSTSTACNARQSAFGLSPRYSPDQIPIHKFYGTHFTNVHPDAIAYLRSPLPQWATIEDCGQFPCTGWSNIVLNFYDAVFTVTDGVTPLPSYWTPGTTSYDFQLVGKVDKAAQSYPGCTLNDAMNGYVCADPIQAALPQIGVLIFESLDADARTRTVAPVIITNSNGYENVLNAFMDHAWDGFYTSQNRLSRFVAQVQTGQHYTVTYTGTPPKNMRYTLRSDLGTAGVIVKVPYPEAGSYDVLVNDVLIDPLAWDSTTKQQLQINPATANCGTNRYVGVENYLEFFVMPGCVVQVRPRDAVMTSVRLQWTVEQFFTSAYTSFVQNMASVLGVDPSRIKIVSVYTGSVVIDIQVLADALTQVINEETGASMPSQAAYQELLTVVNQIEAVFTVDPTDPNDPNLVLLQTVFGTEVGNLLAASEIATNLTSEVIDQCAVKPSDCPQPWPIVMKKDYNNFECAVGMSTSLSSSDAEHCAYVALPDHDAINCKCYCNQDPKACPAATPYFDPTQCKCVCPYKDACKTNFVFVPSTCSCVCPLIETGCPANKPTLNKGLCECECKINPEKCPRAYPEFVPSTCSCQCSLSATICAQNKVNKKFDKPNCACKK